jgi:hypothetical protein
MLTTLALALGRDALLSVIEKRWAGGWRSLEPVLRLVRGVSREDAQRALEALAPHPEPRVRREVLALRCDGDRANAERYLRQGLADPDVGLVHLVIQRLASRGTRESLEILGTYVEEAASSTAAVPQIRRAAEGMVQRGDVGVHRLCGSLHLLRRSFQPSRAAAGAVVRDVLEPYRRDALAARAIAKWRTSPAAFIARFVPAPKPATERP